jgi:hypothetical protein
MCDRPALDRRWAADYGVSMVELISAHVCRSIRLDLSTAHLISPQRSFESTDEAQQNALNGDDPA